MPQLSLHLDEDTLKAIESAAGAEGVFLSRWVAARLRRSIRASWPENCARLFGALKDPSFPVERPADFRGDAARRSL